MRNDIEIHMRYICDTLRFICDREDSQTIDWERDTEIYREYMERILRCHDIVQPEKNNIQHTANKISLLSEQVYFHFALVCDQKDAI